MRVVLDTTILVAAARSRNGASHALLSLLPDLRFEPVVSVPVFLEYHAALVRQENLCGRTALKAEAFLDGLLAMSHIQEIFFNWRPAMPDANDDMILELAVAATACILLHIISGTSGDRSAGESRRFRRAISCD